MPKLSKIIDFLSILLGLSLGIVVLIFIWPWLAWLRRRSPSGIADKFTCAECGGTFEKKWSDEEARAERKKLFPHLTDEDAAVICDDCFEKIVLSNR